LRDDFFADAVSGDYGNAFRCGHDGNVSTAVRIS
jgi:hypothetical protein